MPSSAWSSQQGPLDDLLRGAGARVHREHGESLPADFGSSASELAVCMRAVGIGLFDETESGESLAVAGPRAEKLVRAAALDDAHAKVVRQAPMFYVVSTTREHALEVWRVLVRAGEGLGLGYVGSIAIHNFLVQTQLSSRQMPA
jgi:glycine cleavage system aminomethyltransferase T